MSFQLRIFSLVMLVAGAATMATAYLTQRLMASQLARTAAVSEQESDRIIKGITDFGRSYGSWAGVARRVDDLARATNQRILVRTASDEVVVDTDNLAGRPRRKVPSPGVYIDLKPTLRFENARPILGLVNAAPPQVYTVTFDEIQAYRTGIRFAACLYSNGRTAQVQDSPYGIPHYSGDSSGLDDVNDRCHAGAVSTAEEQAGDRTEIARCAAGPTRLEQLSCLREVFTQRTESPPAVYVYIGAIGTGDGLPAGTTIAAAGLVLLFAAAGTVLLSRRVMRPITALTDASSGLGAGDLTRRVPVRGNDQLTTLTRSFNRMAESLQQGEERQRRLVADVAHELRTPLSNLRGYLEALKDGVIPPGPELFASLHDEAVLQQRIVDDLQDLALAEAGRLAYHQVVVDVVELLTTCQVAHAVLAETAGVRLVLESTGPLHVSADPDRLRQVIGNLISNALRYTPPGGTITIRADAVDGDVVVHISDTGCGIAEQDLPQIFDRFWRADAARGRVTGGSGLGLAIVRQIVLDNGGSITVASDIGVGTTFTITLPLQTIDG